MPSAELSLIGNSYNKLNRINKHLLNSSSADGEPAPLCGGWRRLAGDVQTLYVVEGMSYNEWTTASDRQTDVFLRIRSLDALCLLQQEQPFLFALRLRTYTARRYCVSYNRVYESITIDFSLGESMIVETVLHKIFMITSLYPKMSQSPTLFC